MENTEEKTPVTERAILDTWDDNKVGLSDISCTYHQAADCNDSEYNIQAIKLETVTNGVGSYINISLPDGGHWSIDDKNDLIKLLEDFESRFEYGKE